MDHDADFEIDDMRDMAQGMGHKGGGRAVGSRLLLIAGGVAVVALILGLTLFSNCGDKRTSKEINAIIASMDELEKRMTTLEQSQKSIGELESQIQDLRKSVATMEDAQIALTQEFGKLEKRMSKVKETSAVSAKKETATKSQAQTKAQTPTKKASSPAIQKGYEVKKGDTLFGIAKKHGLTVDELRRLNHLSGQATITPGQTLVVK
jgi:LysM repeat protein